MSQRTQIWACHAGGAHWPNKALSICMGQWRNKKDTITFIWKQVPNTIRNFWILICTEDAVKMQFYVLNLNSANWHCSRERTWVQFRPPALVSKPQPNFQEHEALSTESIMWSKITDTTTQWAKCIYDVTRRSKFELLGLSKFSEPTKHLTHSVDY